MHARLHARARGGRGATGGAHIVNMVSVAGTVSFAPAGAYAASKHAQLAFSRSLSAALRGTGIAVHSILPGFVETEGFPQKNVLKSRLMRRFVIEADDVADAIVKAIEKGKAETVIPWFPYRLVGIAQAVVPGVVARFVGHVGLPQRRRGLSERHPRGSRSLVSPPRLRATYQPISTS